MSYKLNYKNQDGEQIDSVVVNYGYIKAKGIFGEAKQKLLKKIEEGKIGYTKLELVNDKTKQIIEVFDPELDQIIENQIEEKDKTDINTPEKKQVTESYTVLMKTRIKEIEGYVYKMTDVQKKIMGNAVLESINAILEINKKLMGYEPEYVTENGEIILNAWGMPEVEKYSFEKFELKQLIDFQFHLAGHYGFLSDQLAKFKGNAGLKKAKIDIASNYLYSPAKDYITEQLQEKRTDKYIQSVIDNQLIPEYANQRMSAVIATMLEAVCKSAELTRNVLNSTIQYIKEDLVNSVHLSNSQL